MTVLVTGGGGFIGSHLVQALTESPESIRVMHRSMASQSRLSSTQPDVEHVVADLNDRNDLRRALVNVSTVYHLAGYGSPGSPRDMAEKIMRVNVTGTCSLLQECVGTGVNRLVFASSASVYGDSAESPKTESMPTRPKTLYAASKTAAEELCSVFDSQLGLDTRILRFFNVYGPGQSSDMVIPRFMEMLRTGQTVTMYGDGQQTRDFIHVSDVVRATISAGNVDNIDTHIFNIGSGVPTSIRDIIETLGQILNVSPQVVYLPERLGEIRTSLASIDVARTQLAFEPSCLFKVGLNHLVHASQCLTR